MDNGHASVLIAGGSIAGLMLANLLELASVDYLVLDKYRTIAPDLGASIGISANSARLLDQIGVWNKLEQLYDREDVYTQQIDGMNGYWHKFMAQYIVPFLIKDESSMIKLWSERILGAARFDFAEMPHQPHSILYDDEKPLKPDAGPYSVGTVCALGATIFSICVASRMFFEICGGGEGDSVAGEFKGAGWCEKGGTRVDLRLGRPWTKE
ncbi:Putative FAD-binding domain, FAD/NAD(P)-binding domain superfamily [Septoria linicola]|uniref:FAD-binding domain, FAD/NAD(P)-binding domain superfamily n=1 Tax=Septoria linicola TaxID=215465 RepID=A0A9Q9AUN0_9PEZI|nr:Putative FAD-binding domain, FAD/NAD(P)-binding domain superfamily [Septoria linicola]